MKASFDRMNPGLPFYTISPVKLELEGVLEADLSFDVQDEYVTVGWKGGKRHFMRSKPVVDVSVSRVGSVLTVSVS